VGGAARWWVPGKSITMDTPRLGTSAAAGATPLFSHHATPVLASPSPFRPGERVGGTAAGGEGISVPRLRGLIRSAMANSQDESALFFADKLVTITGEPADVHAFAQCLFRARQYSRALFHLERRGLLGPAQIPFRLIAARCLAALSNWDDCLTIIEGSIGNTVARAKQVADLLTAAQQQQHQQHLHHHHHQQGAHQGDDHDQLDEPAAMPRQPWAPGDSIHEVASLCCVRADVLVAMENRARAIEWCVGSVLRTRSANAEVRMHAQSARGRGRGCAPPPPEHREIAR
jgi:hypothetical protein